MYFLTFLFRELSCLWKSTPIPSSTGEGGPLMKKFESFGWTGKLEWIGELPGLGKGAISEPESGVGGKPKHVSSTENIIIKTHRYKKNHCAIISLIRRTPPSVKRQIYYHRLVRASLSGGSIKNRIILVIGCLYLSLLWSVSLKTGEMERAVSTRAAISSLLVTFSCRLVQPLNKGKGFWIELLDKEQRDLQRHINKRI